MRALAGAVLVVAMALGVAQGDDAYPARPVSMVVAFPPGGLADNTARPVAAVLERLLKQPVVVVNKAGAAGAVGRAAGPGERLARNRRPGAPPRAPPSPGRRRAARRGAG